MNDVVVDEAFQSKEYRALIKEHLYKTIEFLLKKGIEFSIAAEVDYIKFNPPLPENIKEKFYPVSLFVLSNYTFETTHIEDDNLVFEAGFGEDNIGTVVSIPLLAIKQIFVDEYPLVINITEAGAEEMEKEVTNSMEAILANPENAQLLKRLKKR